MKAITDLQALGYTFALDGDSILYTHDGDNPDPAQVRPLLEYLRRHREDAIQFLQLMNLLEAAWRLVEPGGPKENDEGAVTTFLALLQNYMDAHDAQALAA